MLNKFLNGDIVVICNNRDEEKQLMSFLEENTKVVWRSSHKPTQWSSFKNGYGNREYGG